MSGTLAMHECPDSLISSESAPNPYILTTGRLTAVWSESNHLHLHSKLFVSALITLWRTKPAFCFTFCRNNQIDKYKSEISLCLRQFSSSTRLAEHQGTAGWKTSTLSNSHISTASRRLKPTQRWTACPFCKSSVPTADVMLPPSQMAL